VLGFSGVASAAGGCPNEAFRTGEGARLPDCRAFEQATSVDKNGGNAEGIENLVGASPSGDAITFTNAAGVPGGFGAANFPSFLARRGPESWATTGLLPPEQYGQQAEVLGFTEDRRYSFSRDAYYGRGEALLRQSTADGHVDVIVPAGAGTPHGTTYGFAGASADDSKVYFEARGESVALTANAVPGVNNLYVWDATTDSISLVGVLPGGEAAPEGSFAGPYEWNHDNTYEGGANSFRAMYTIPTHAVSTDGKRVYFTAAGTGQLYLRQSPAAANASTVRVSASQRTTPDPSGPQPAAFLAATPDGGMAFFKSSEELTNNANTGSADEGSDLYGYDASSGDLTDLTPDTNPSDPNGAEVQGVLGASDDGSYVYFAANGVLASNTGAEGSTATHGNCEGFENGGRSCNLYLWHAGSITFISSLEEGYGELTTDDENWQPTSRPISKIFGKTARVTPGGKTLLFRSTRSLTGYVGDCEEFGGPCTEFFRYSADTGQLNCVSCSPSGLPAVGAPVLQPSKILAFAGQASAGIQTRNLSVSGDQVFFATPDPLVTADTNGTDGCSNSNGTALNCQDVYEWEADGAGSCRSTTQNGGCLYLLSSGLGEEPAFFGDASASGDDVFIFTPRPEVPADEDRLYDVYDLRVDGGMASQHRTVPPGCLGEACHALASSPPVAAVVASVGFSGPGNVKQGAGQGNVVASSRVRTLTKTLHSASFLVKVSVPGGGRVTISGADVISVRRSVAKAGTYELRVMLTRKGRRLLTRRRKPTVTLRVAYAPAAATTTTVGGVLTGGLALTFGSGSPGDRTLTARSTMSTRRPGR
jgi:hypothetical protein